MSSIPESRSEYHKKYYQENKDKYKYYNRRENRKNFYERNKERLRQKARERYWKNRERLLQEHAAYYKTPEGKANKQKSEALRRSRKRSNGGSFTYEQWERVCEYYGNICLRCKKKLKLTVDHVLPVSLGGTGYIENIQPLCSRCNSGKCNRHIDYRPDGGEFCRLLQGAG